MSVPFLSSIFPIIIELYIQGNLPTFNLILSSPMSSGAFSPFSFLSSSLPFHLVFFPSIFFSFLNLQLLPSISSPPVTLPCKYLNTFKSLLYNKIKRSLLNLLPPHWLHLPTCLFFLFFLTKLVEIIFSLLSLFPHLLLLPTCCTLTLLLLWNYF